MLSIYFGDMNEVWYGPTYFRYNYESHWLEDPFVNEMMQDIDQSRYVGGSLIESDVLGPIPPEHLSGGLRTLIMIYECPELVFDATSCGDNCAKWLLEIGKKKDVKVNLNYCMSFDGMDPFEICIENEKTIVRNYMEYISMAVKYL